jgi:HK97 family phage major capsid protein
MLEDAGINVEEWMGRKVSDKFSRVENTGYMVGTGVGQPRGLLSYPAGTNNGQIEQVVSGAATDFTFDGLINVQYALKDPYAANANWMFNRLGVRNVAKLKDGQSRYLWEPSKQKGEPSTLMGDSVYRAADMAAPGAGALMGAYGDFREAYTIVDRLGITVLRDPFTAKPFVLFYTRKRTGGDVTNFEAVKIIVGST